jgi:hypothetical protein
MEDEVGRFEMEYDSSMAQAGNWPLKLIVG